MKQFEIRTSLLVKEKLNNLHSATIAVIGLGGVGGIAAESLVRSSVGNLIIIDKDNFEESNLNRQILATTSDLGDKKTAVAEKRFKDINKDANITAFNVNLEESNLSLLDNYQLDYVLDCIDSLPAKWALIKYALKRQIPIISIMGMGNRFDASKIVITTLDKSFNDPVARKLRKFARKDNIDKSLVNILISTELPMIQNEVINKKVPPASMIFVPSVAGLLAANFIIRNLINYLKTRT